MLYTIAFDNFLDQTGVPLMRAVRNSLALLAASVVMCGVAQAQDKASLSQQVVATNSTARIALEMKTEPTLAWGSRTQVSGLFVDLIMPQQTWAMLKPSGQPRDLSMPIPLQPVTAPLTMNDNLDVRELNFPFLNFSF
jgi:hypothetical protein